MQKPLERTPPHAALVHAALCGASALVTWLLLRGRPGGQQTKEECREGSSSRGGGREEEQHAGARLSKQLAAAHKRCASFEAECRRLRQEKVALERLVRSMAGVAKGGGDACGTPPTTTTIAGGEKDGAAAADLGQAAVQGEAVEALVYELQEAQQAVAELEQRVRVSHSGKNASERARRELEAQLGAIRAAGHIKERDLRDRVQNLHGKLEAALRAKGEAERELASLRERSGGMQSRLQSTTVAVERLSQDLHACQEERERLRSSLKREASTRLQRDRQLAAAQAQAQRLESELRVAKDSYHRLDTSLQRSLKAHG